MVRKVGNVGRGMRGETVEESITGVINPPGKQAEQKALVEHNKNSVFSQRAIGSQERL